MVLVFLVLVSLPPSLPPNLNADRKKAGKRRRSRRETSTGLRQIPLVFSERLIVIQPLLKRILTPLRLHIRVPPGLDQLRARGRKGEASHSCLDVLFHIVGGVFTGVPTDGPSIAIEEKLFEVEGDAGDLVGVPEGLAEEFVEGVGAFPDHVDFVEDEGVGVLPEAVLLVVFDADDSVFVGFEGALLGGEDPDFQAFGTVSVCGRGEERGVSE